MSGARSLPAAPSRPRRALVASTLVAAALAAHLAAAQPYAADGGFDRPQRVAEGQMRPIAALALDHGVATLVRAVDGWLVAEPRDGGAAHRLDDADGVRWLVADGGPDRPLVAIWSRRDPTTGRYVFRWGDGDELLRTAQPLVPVPVATRDGPLVLVARGDGDGAVLERLDGAGAGTVLHRTPLRLASLSATADGDGHVHLTWIEGRTETSALGTRSTWTARAATWRPGDGLVSPVDLGATPDGFAPTSTTWDGDDVRRTWIDGDGGVRVTVGEAGTGALATRAEGPAGRPVAALADATYVTDGGTVRRLDASGAVPVAWSPLTIADAWAVRDADGVTHLAWVGTETGGDHALYVADDRRPMVRTWRDHLAAWLGWSPWNLAEEAAGQLAGSALAAVLVAMAAAPLLWLLAIPFAGRGSARRASRRGAVAGAALGPLLAVVLVAAGVSASTLGPLVGGWVTLVASSAVAGVLAAGLIGRRDLEPSPAFVAAGTTAVGIATVIVAFVAFQRWLALTLV